VVGLRGNDRRYWYPHSGLVETLMNLFDELYLDLLDGLDSHDTLSIFKLAAWSMISFLTIHPYADGNGRMSRLIVSHVLKMFVPFPVATYHSDRDVYLNVLYECQAEDGKISAPRNLCAMIIENTWIGWKSLRVSLQNWRRLSLEPITRTLVLSGSSTIGESFRKQLKTVCDSKDERSINEHLNSISGVQSYPNVCTIKLPSNKIFELVVTESFMKKRSSHSTTL